MAMVDCNASSIFRLDAHTMQFDVDVVTCAWCVLMSDADPIAHAAEDARICENFDLDCKLSRPLSSSTRVLFDIVKATGTR
jgi:hypothetical protein